MTMQSIQATPSQNTASATPLVAASRAAADTAQNAPVAAPGVTTNATSPNVDAKSLADAIGKVQDVTKTLANGLKFDIDENSGKVVVKVIDTATDEVLRQIPSEEMLAIAEALDKFQGLLIKQDA